MQMAIRPGEYDSYDYDRMIVRFTMVDDEVVVPCSISTDAMDSLESGAGAKANQREAQFMRLRERIEALAATKILKGEFEGMSRGIVLRSIDLRQQ